MTDRRRHPLVWIAGTVLYTAFAASVTVVVLSLSAPDPFDSPVVIGLVTLSLVVPGVLAAYRGYRDWT